MTRQSNIELLRWLSMLMIVIFHINGHAFTLSSPCLSAEWSLWHITNTLTVTATSVFVLISGYFGIHFKTKGLLSLYLRCAVWGIIGYVLYGLCANTPPIEPTKLFARLMPFTHGKWWFIITYLELYFLSPILNAAIEMFDKRKHMLAILIFGFVTLYMGYCRETGEDTWGTSLSHFLWLYMIARYIFKYVSLDVIRAKRWWWIGGFIVASAITFGLAVLETKFTVPCCLRPYPYCSPWVLAAALCLLLMALSVTFESKVVNWFASSSLSAYLMDGSPYFGRMIWFPTLATLFMSLPLFARYALLIPFAIAWLSLVCMVDKVWELIIYKPVMKLFNKLPISDFSV